MAKTITQKIVFKDITANFLYDLYMNAILHTEVTGARATITAKEGTTFTCYDGYITGMNLKLVKNSLIVQSWRGSDWDEKSLDSTFVLFLETKGENVVVHIVHSNLPDEHADSIDKGWHEYYWKPWKNCISSNLSNPLL